MSLLLAILLLLLLPSPWNLIAAGLSLVLFAGEVAFWHGRVRRTNVGAGAETLIGEQATVVSACRPRGQVTVLGEIWEATCREGADRGDVVRIVGRDRLLLIVERDPSAAPA
jgi:membrane-bound serine protease (ClpP class)